MATHPPTNGLTVLIAACLTAAVMGSIHAFSVFLSPLEAQFAASRSAVSLTYSLALVSLTIVVLIGPRLYARASAASLMLAACGIGACGAVLAGLANSLPMVWLGYSLIFGAANGLGYGFGLQIAAQTNPTRQGLAMGIVTAAYALGAVAAPPIFATATASHGFAGAMLTLAAILAITGVNCAILLARSKARFQTPPNHRHTAIDPRLILHYWCAYGSAVIAGLMAIGHAAGIATALNPQSAPWIAPAAIAICNLAGAFLGGRLSDAMPPRLLLTALPILSATGLILLAAPFAAPLALPALGLIGFAYGAIIAIYPAVISRQFGADGPRIYGRVFTAWGTAGLFAPWVAGQIFDWSGGYGPALWVACGLGVVSVVVALRIFR